MDEQQIQNRMEEKQNGKYKSDTEYKTLVPKCLETIEGWIK